MADDEPVDEEFEAEYARHYDAEQAERDEQARLDRQLTAKDLREMLATVPDDTEVWAVYDGWVMGGPLTVRDVDLNYQTQGKGPTYYSRNMRVGERLVILDVG